MSGQVNCFPSSVGTTDGTTFTQPPTNVEALGQPDQASLLLEEFRARLANDGLCRPATHDAQASHDDATLMYAFYLDRRRFLRARRYDVAKAYKQFADTEAWRKQNDVDDLFKNFDRDEMESARRFYPRWTGRRDKCGLPIYVYRLASLDSSLRKELDMVSPERRYQRMYDIQHARVVLCEVMTRFVLPLCNHLPHDPPVPVSSVTTIIDLENVSLSNMWSLRTHLQQASTMATAHYPETLNTIAVVNCPSFFPTIWNWIKGWFDEGTRRKIHVLGKEPGALLQTLISNKDLPVVYGGELEWVFGDEPHLDSEALAVVNQMPKGPVTFEELEGTR
ncbi:hypothetical protein ID866_5357 [Astraeus odoratus]|nr:hypothetical protein ID866_5357 [Astraeus odoratus]